MSSMASFSISMGLPLAKALQGLCSDNDGLSVTERQGVRKVW